MQIDLIFKIASIGIVVSIINQLLIHSGRQEQAFMVTLAGVVIVLLLLIPQISEFFNTVQSVFGF